MGSLGSQFMSTSDPANLTGMGKKLGAAWVAPDGSTVNGFENPVTSAQTAQSYNDSQNALAQQQALLQAITAQGGLNNQSNVYSQMQGVANGTGPNPAQAMLAQQTGANNSAQAAMMAGQRGASQNVGLMARQAAQQGSANQQNAIGQGASLQAQQSMNALNSMGGIANQQVSNQMGAANAYTNAAQGEQGNLLGAQSQYNNALMGYAGGANNANANVSMANAKMNAGMLGGILGGAGAAAAAEGGQVGTDIKAPPVPQQRYASGGDVSVGGGPKSSFGRYMAGQSNGSQAPQGFQSIQNSDNPLQAGTQQLVGTLAKKYIKPMFQNHGGGSVNPSGIGSQYNQAGPNLDVAGVLPQGAAQGPSLSPNVNFTPNGQQNSGAYQFGNTPATDAAAKASPLASVADKAPDLSAAEDLGDSFAHGGKVQALVSPGERYLPPREVAKVAKGQKSPMEAGEKIPGKPAVGGAKNDYANDTVPKTLDEGGIVLPRSVTQSKNPQWAAHKFMSDIMSRKKAGQ